MSFNCPTPKPPRLASQPPARQDEPNEANESLEQARGGHTGAVLIAEDDDNMRDLLGRVLRAEGYDVHEASDGAELMCFVVTGLLRGIALTVDVIVSDIRMPAYSGLDALAALRAEDWTTPVVLLTAFGSREAHWEAERLGAMTLLDKPFELETLLQAIARLVPPTF